MLSLETCEKLKTAGWEQQGDGKWIDGILYSPTLEELLEAIRAELLDTDGYVVLSDGGDRWVVSIDYVSDDGLKLGQCNYTHKDPSEAAAALWLKLKGVV